METKNDACSCCVQIKEYHLQAGTDSTNQTEDQDNEQKMRRTIEVRRKKEQVKLERQEIYFKNLVRQSRSVGERTVKVTAKPGSMCSIAVSGKTHLLGKIAKRVRI